MPHSPTRTGERAAWQVKVITLFPEMFPGPLAISLVGQALKAGLWSLTAIALRDFGLGRHRSVDDTPAGGGSGMIMRPDVVGPAIESARHDAPNLPLIYLSPRGKPLRQKRVKELAAGPGAILLAGRFEGIDERVIEANDVEEVSIGDFILSGGELPAMIMIDACVRQLPGVLGAESSLDQESFENGLLEYPQYTRPRVWEGREIPDVLLSGDHGRIAKWRQQQAERVTKQRRPDLLKKTRS